MKQTLSYKIAGLDCAEEVAILKNALNPQKSIENLEFDILNAKITLTYDPASLDSEEIIQLIASTGMQAIPWEKRQTLSASTWWIRHRRSILTSASGLCLIIGTALHVFAHPSFKDILGGYAEKKTHVLPTSSLIFYLASAFLGASLVIPKALLAVRRLRPDMNLLLIIASVGAMAIGEWFEAATVCFLFSVAALLESWSIERGRRAIASLLDLSPKRARVIIEGQEHPVEKDVRDVEIGNLLLIRPGEKIPLDAVIVKGSSSVNQAPLTGESLPVPKSLGDEVFAGTINEEGMLECRVAKKAADSTLERMIQLIEKARSKRAKSEQWVEKFAGFYTPAMFLFALLIACLPPLFFLGPWNEWIYRSLVILVIACPCALVISTPVSIISGLTRAARSGVLIKGGIHLEAPASLKAIAIDKTGTLTYGRPKVQRVIALDSYTEEQILRVAAALEIASAHPIARAIVKKAEEKKISFQRIDHFQSITGKGAEGLLRGDFFWIGSHRLMHEKKQETTQIHDLAAQLEDAGHSVVAIGNAERVIGLISVADAPREFIRETISTIQGLGVEKIAMLTGDNESTAKAIASLSGITDCFSELLPEDKAKIIRSFVEDGYLTAMVGDGVNDALAMVEAHLGIAMGAMGSDAAIETADIALMTDDLSRIPWLIRHSRRTLKIIKQNIAFSLSLKLVFILLALSGFATLWLAIAADTGASLVVVFNALRLLKKDL
ncbi:MAG: heavy metal translocating P-type ATPase [Anaerolineae bacterium]